MLRITRIVGESFDLETGEEHARALEVTNGHSSRLIPVSPEALENIVELFAEARGHATQEPTTRLDPGERIEQELVKAVMQGVQEDEDAEWVENVEELVEPVWADSSPPEGDDSLDAYEDEDTGVGSI